MRISVAPGGLDSNKGDQALVAASVALAKSISPSVDIGVIGSSGSGLANDSGEMRHTKNLGVELFCSILTSPRREKLRRAGAEDGVNVRLAMAINALKDFTWSFSLLAVCRIPFIARLFLSRPKQQTYKFLRDSNYIFIKGGGFIYSYRGLRYYYYIYMQLYLIMLAHRLGVQVIIMPNSFGPFVSRFSKWLVARVLNRCTLIATRERISHQRLLDIGVKGGLIRSLPDIGFMTKGIDKVRAKELLLRAGLNSTERLVGFTVRPWRFPLHKNPAKAWENYINTMVALVKHVIEKNYKPVFFPQSIGPHDHEDDRIAIRTVCRKLKPNSYYVVDGDWLPSELVGMYGMMEFFVGTRMHSVIFAVINAVPAIAISYQGPKATGIMRDIGLSDFVIPIESATPKCLKNMFNALVENKESVADQISKAVSQIHGELEKWKREIMQVCQAYN